MNKYLMVIFFIFLLSEAAAEEKKEAEESVEILIGSSDIPVSVKPSEDHQEKIVDKNKPESPHKFEATVGFFSDYYSRGISQTMLKPAVQGELIYEHASGFYARMWASNVDGTGNFLTNTSMEWDFYIGLEKQLLNIKDLQYEVGILVYYYPGGAARLPFRVPYNTAEYYFGITYKNFEIKLSQTLTDYFGVNSHNPPFNWSKKRFARPNGHSFHSPYFEANYVWVFHPKWSMAFHLGYQRVVNYSELNYVDWQITLTREFKWFDVFLYYVATDAKKAFYDVRDNSFKGHRKNLGAPSVVVGVGRAF